MRTAIYARVSTDDRQTTENQLRELRATAASRGWEVVAEYVDEGISGAKGREGRPGYDAMLKAVEAGQVDVVAAWAVDRLGRSMIDLVGFLLTVHKHNAGLYLQSGDLDTTTPGGRLQFQLMGAFAEYERSMIRARVKAGVDRAKANGVRCGRDWCPLEVEKKILALRNKRDREGRVWGMNRIARELGIGNKLVQRVVQRGSVRENT